MSKAKKLRLKNGHSRSPLQREPLIYVPDTVLIKTDPENKNIVTLLNLEKGLFFDISSHAHKVLVFFESPRSIKSLLATAGINGTRLPKEVENFIKLMLKNGFLKKLARGDASSNTPKIPKRIEVDIRKTVQTNFKLVSAEKKQKVDSMFLAAAGCGN